MVDGDEEPVPPASHSSSPPGLGGLGLDDVRRRDATAGLAGVARACRFQ
jgi:hypothetical protein